jgi:transposase InsO family protein
MLMMILMIFFIYFPQDAGSSAHLRVLHAENVVNVLTEIHGTELKHSGYKKVLEYAQRHYQGPTRDFVQKYCLNCPKCQLSTLQIERPPLQPMVHGNDDFLERVQIDLIDMRHCPDANFMDHFSKFHVLFPLKIKSAAKVGCMLEERVLAYFGPPKIFHSDNDREFVNNVMRSLFEVWGGQVTFINGRPRHP